jgi:transposase
MAMDIHLDTLLNLPDVTVFTVSEKEGFIFLTLDLINPGISCPHCHHYTETIRQTSSILVRDLSICGKAVFLRVPRRKFYCPHCQHFPTERFDWLEMRRNFTIRYEQYIYERVKELTVEQVSQNEQLTPEQVQGIFSRQAALKKKTGVSRKD